MKILEISENETDYVGNVHSDTVYVGTSFNEFVETLDTVEPYEGFRIQVWENGFPVYLGDTRINFEDDKDKEINKIEYILRSKGYNEFFRKEEKA